MTLAEYALFAFSSLFVIIDPIATVPAFLAMTPNDTPTQRIKMARLACVISAVILLLFALTGEIIFNFLGVSLPAFKIAGSIVLLLVALDMLRARRSAVRETSEETDAGASKEDIAVTPLAVPMLAGPGAITTAILLRDRASGVVQEAALCVCIAAVCLASFLIFSLSARGAKWLNPIAMRITTRIMGLLLASVAIQFMLDALRAADLLGAPGKSP
jgi:multiple antibiotic resistance protein